MCANLVAKVRRVPSSFAFVVLLIAAVCIVSAGCSGPKGDVAATDVMPLAARVDRLDGEVGIDRQTDPQDSSQDQPNTDWGKATVNTPVSVGSRVYVKDKSHAAIAFSGRNYARLNPRTSLDVLSLSQRRTQLALRDGSGIFDIGALAPGELFEVATPNGAVDFQQPGLYQVGIDDRGRQQQKQQQKAERKTAQGQPAVQQQQQKQQQKAERKAATQQQQQPPVQQQQQKQQQKAERKAAAQQQQPPAQTSPSKADRKAAKTKKGNNSGNLNQ